MAVARDRARALASIDMKNWKFPLLSMRVTPCRVSGSASHCAHCAVQSGNEYARLCPDLLGRLQFVKRATAQPPDYAIAMGYAFAYGIEWWLQGLLPIRKVEAVALQLRYPTGTGQWGAHCPT
jgi:hypothetical protein